MKRVAFFITNMDSGGIENYLLRFLRFSEHRIDPFVICKGGKYGELYDDYVKIKNVQILKLDKAYFSVRNFKAIYKFLRKNDIQTVCDFTGNFAGLVMFFAKLSGVTTRRITFYRNSDIKFDNTPARKIVNKFLKFLVLRFATKILSNSESALNNFHPKWQFNSNGKFSVIYNGIDFSNFLAEVNSIELKAQLGLPKQSFVIGHIGRYDSQKNHKTILNVAEQLCKKYDCLYFVLCGKNTDTGLIPLIRQSPVLMQRVFILGYRKDINNLLQIFDIFFFPSTIEGQPNALIEAMVSGLPIVASDIQPIKETTPESLHSKLKDPMDIDGFVKEIERAFLDAQYRQTLIFADWAKQNFDHNVLFYQFLHEL